MKKSSALLLTLLSAILFSISLPNEFFHYGNPLISIICLVPFFTALIQGRGNGFSALLGFIFGSVSSLLTYFWLIFFQDFSIWTVTGTAVAHGLYFAVFAPVISFSAKSDKHWRPFVIAAVWVSYEFLKSSGYLGFPWGLMAHPAGSLLPLIQISEITGIWGVSYMFTLLNSLIAEAVNAQFFSDKPTCRSKKRHYIINQCIFTGLLFLSSLVFGIIRMGVEIPADYTINALLIQQNTDSWVRGKELESIKTGQDLSRKGLESAEKRPDIVVWNENSFRYPYEEESQLYKIRPKDDPFLPFLKEINTPLLTGNPVILDMENYKILNAAVLLSPEGKILQYYGKSHPVPFAENNPLWDIPIIQRFFRDVIGMQNAGWTPGDKNKLFTLALNSGGSIKFAVPICFEDSFPDLCRYFIKNGADLLINITNDAWSKTVSGETQHFVTARYRAIENKRVLLRSTNAGVTCVINPYGILSDTLPLYVPGFVNAEVPVYKEKNFTIYTLFGDYFPLSLIIILTGMLIRFNIRGFSRNQTLEHISKIPDC